MKWFRSAQRWLGTGRFLDLFYSYYLNGLSDFHHVLHEIGSFYQSPETAKKKPTYRPQLEGLETRVVPTTVQYSVA